MVAASAKSYATAHDVSRTSSPSSYAGGLVGSMNDGGSVGNSYATEQRHAPTPYATSSVSYAGGLAGMISG